MAVPNFKAKYISPSVITPKQFLDYRIKREGKPSFKQPKLAILCYSWSLLDYILKNYKTTKVEGFIADIYLLNETNNEVAIFSKFGIGAPAVTILFEELIAFGIKKFITIGNAGAIQKDLKIGDIILCERAIRDEGVSYHYIKASKYAYPSKKLLKIIKAIFERKKTKYKSGTTWSHDVMYRETLDEIKHYQKEGVLCVELEAASLFTVGQYRKVDILAIFVISDSLAKLNWNPCWHHKNNIESFKKIFSAIMSLPNQL